MDDQTEQRMNQLTEQLEGLDQSRADVCAQICTVYGQILTEMESVARSNETNMSHQMRNEVNICVKMLKKTAN